MSKNLHRRHLNESQRAMIAGKLATLKRGQVASQRADVGISTPSQGEAAKMLNVSRDSVLDARTVQKHGSKQEIEAIEQGKAAVSTVAKKLRAKLPKPAPKKGAKAHAGKNPERIENMRVRAQVWGNLRDALEALTSLPDAKDVVRIAQAMDNKNLVGKRLKSALEWLETFDHAWDKRGDSNGE